MIVKASQVAQTAYPGIIDIDPEFATTFASVVSFWTSVIFPLMFCCLVILYGIAGEIKRFSKLHIILRLFFR